MYNYKIILLFILFDFCISQKRLQPVLFTNNRIYSLINQHTGKYLSAGEDGNYIKTRDSGFNSVDQLWKVNAINKDGFKLVPLNGNKTFESIWKPIYLGYGKYQLQNINNQLCLEASENRIESECNKDNLLLEWFPSLKESPTISPSSTSNKLKTRRRNNQTNITNNSESI